MRSPSVLAALSCLFSLISAIENNTVAHDLFISSDFDVAFTLNVANDSDDIFFSLMAPAASSWIAVGFGSDQMRDSLMFIAYASASGTNVTLSPRLPANHVEPVYTSDIQFEILPGSVADENTIIANVRCSNCRGRIGNTDIELDLNSTSQKMSYATALSGSLRSNSPMANLRRHEIYGSFTVDMQKASGPGGLALIPTENIPDVGASQTSQKHDLDISPALHGVIMIFAFLCIMPFGVILLRVFGWVTFHAINQTFAAILALAGLALGIYIGQMYNRTKNFNATHQIFGTIIVACLLGQNILGFLHHRAQKQTQTTSKNARIHIWLGRLVIPAGIINAFLGFPLAQAAFYNYWLSGLVVPASLLFALILIWKQRRSARKAKETMPQEAPPAYPTYPLDESGSNIALQNMQSYPASYEYENSRPMETHGAPVEPWHRV